MTPRHGIAMTLTAHQHCRSIFILLAVFVCLPMLISGTAEGKDLQKRLGVGVYVQPGMVPALGIRYGFPANDKALNIQIEALVGIKASKQLGSEQAFGGLRLQHALVAEDHLNFFVAATGLYLYEAQSGGDPLSGFDTRLTAGSEIFLFGLQNLGISMEAGIQTTGLSQGDADRSITVQSTAALGFHYYF